MSVCQGFFDDQGVCGVELERVGHGCCFCCALGCVIVADGLDDFAETAVGVAETRMGLLDLHLLHFGTEVGFG